LVISGSVDELATIGSRRLAVRIDGDRTADWVPKVPGITVSEIEGGAVRLALEDSVDSDVILRAAMGAGRVTEFSFARRRLSEVFRETLR
jgi:ABC-2 type transport system ATP-binding protein